jgi:hypothetical protein
MSRLTKIAIIDIGLAMAGASIHEPVKPIHQPEPINPLPTESEPPMNPITFPLFITPPLYDPPLRRDSDPRSYGMSANGAMKRKKFKARKQATKKGKRR